MLRRRVVLLLGIVAAMVAGTIVARRRGYPIGGQVVVRCRQGHLFTTLWVPGVSIKSIRLGWWRFQWCPVGRHWSLVQPVRTADLTPEEAQAAGSYHDARVP
jgi:hypothetical protein